MKTFIRAKRGWFFFFVSPFSLSPRTELRIEPVSECKMCQFVSRLLRHWCSTFARRRCSRVRILRRGSTFRTRRFVVMFHLAIRVSGTKIYHTGDTKTEESLRGRNVIYSLSVYTERSNETISRSRIFCVSFSIAYISVNIPNQGDAAETWRPERYGEGM